MGSPFAWNFSFVFLPTFGWSARAATCNQRVQSVIWPQNRPNRAICNRLIQPDSVVKNCFFLLYNNPSNWSDRNPNEWTMPLPCTICTFGFVLINGPFEWFGQIGFVFVHVVNQRARTTIIQTILGIIKVILYKYRPRCVIPQVILKFTSFTGLCFEQVIHLTQKNKRTN